MMARTREFNLPPGSELARVIDESLGAPIVMVKDGVRYRLERESSNASMEPDDAPIRATNDDDQEALDRIVGSWADVDADALIEELRLAREAGSRPIDRAPTLR